MKNMSTQNGILFTIGIFAFLIWLLYKTICSENEIVIELPPQEPPPDPSEWTTSSMNLCYEPSIKGTIDGNIVRYNPFLYTPVLQQELISFKVKIKDQESVYYCFDEEGLARSKNARCGSPAKAVRRYFLNSLSKEVSIASYEKELDVSIFAKSAIMDYNKGILTLEFNKPPGETEIIDLVYDFEQVLDGYYLTYEENLKSLRTNESPQMPPKKKYHVKLGEICEWQNKEKYLTEGKP